MILLSVILSALGACLYRLGGCDLSIPNKTKIRDAGVPFVGCLIVAMNNYPLTLWTWLGLIMSFGLGWGSMTTYFKHKGDDATWFNWLLVGLAFGVCFLPFALASGQWAQFGIRTALLTLLIPIGCTLLGNAVVEELFRGFIFCVTLLIFHSPVLKVL